MMDHEHLEHNTFLLLYKLKACKRNIQCIYQLVKRIAQLLCWVQTHVLESCILSHCVIYKSKQSSMCLHTFTLQHIFAIWYKNHCKYKTKTSTCRERQSWCSLHAEVFVSFLQWFLYQTTKTWRDVNEGRHIKLCLDLYITQWDKIHDSKTCVWTQH